MSGKSSGLNGQQLAKANVRKFRDWITERDEAGDWQDYVRGDKLSRSDIGAECGFALAVLRQNPAVKGALETLENRLRADGVLPSVKWPLSASSKAAEASSKALDQRIVAARVEAEAKMKTLEEQNVLLKIEVRDLREQLARYKHLEDHLCRTGRMLHQ